jgi:hypothetical protein
MELCERRKFLLVMSLVGAAIYIALCAWRFSMHGPSICYLTEHHAFLKSGVNSRSITDLRMLPSYKTYKKVVLCS